MRLRRTLAAVGILVVIVTVAAVVLRAGTGPAAASTDPGGGEVAGGGIASGSINGTVTEEGTGTPLAGICVDANDISFEFFSFGTTDASGAYSVGGLGSGDYEVQFSDCSESPTYVTEWYNDRPDFYSADLVAVTDGSKTSGIDAQLATGGSINGTVTEEGTGTPLADICVNAVDSSFSFFGFGETDASGAYSVGGLGSGDYEVEFFDCGESVTYIMEFYNDRADFNSADLVAVTIGSKTSGIDAALAVGGSINGTVTDEATGTPLADICVSAQDPLFSSFGFGETDESGAYSVGGLGSGDYEVEFFDCGETVTYIMEFYNDRADFNSADLVAVVAGSKTSGIDAALAAGGSINGTVTEDGTGTPLADICVETVDSSFSFFGFALTDALGGYSVGGLAAGDYTVNFYDCGDTDTYFAEYYDDQVDFGFANLVAVVAGSKTSGIDAGLSGAAVVLIGDANCNENVDSIDATVVLQFVAGLLAGLPCADAADTNGDGDITSVDATLILQFTAGLLDVLGAVG